MDVGGWLRGLALGQYEEQFRDNKIDADVLPRLTVDDLKDIGVSVVGDRRRLLDAIDAIAGAGPASPAKSAPSKGLQASAERRPITVMFCDLVGSTSLAAKLDAEDWRNLVNAYLDEASAAVTGLGGHVLKKLGDGLMALFGYPHAQENDAERAVRAALAIQRALVEINARNAGKGAPELSARIGLDSGQVVVDATGEVFGDAPNIAARVQSAAEPGSILITAAVQRQTAGLFAVEDKGAHGLKGVSAPTTLYRVIRASGAGRRGGARVLTPLVGREEELGLLTRRWERAHKGEGQLALIVGEPGLGKSRLMEEFHGRLGETPHTWVEWSSSQLLQNTPLHPIADWGRQRFGADVPAEQRLADLEHTLRLIGLNPNEYAPLLAPLVDVLLPEDRAAKLPPEELRRRQLAAMTAWILAAARTQAVVLAFEDLHWADPTSLDLMRALAERGAQAPLLIIATARPEFRPPWSVRSHHSVISLSPLDSMQIAKMVSELSSRHALPRDVVEGVSERTGGVPLFIEEVTRLLLERGEQGGAQSIPPTLQQSLAARLDRLGAARETAQIGAVLGRGFSYALLRSVAGLDEGALQSALAQLAQADILFIEGDGPQANYRFKHALIQDAAYDSLLKSRRQALHAQAAEILRESASSEPEAIAHHFTQAGLDDLAIGWWGKAGDQALRRSAFQEAIAHLGKAIAMADKERRADSRTPANVSASQKMQLHADLSQATMLAKGYTAKETKEALAHLEEAAQQTGDTKPSFTDLYARWVVNLMQGRHARAKEAARAFLRAAQSVGGSTEIAAAHRVLGWSCFALGELESAFSEYRSGLHLLRETADDDSRFRFGVDTRGSADGYRSCACWVAGDVEEWRVAKAAAQARAEALGHVATSVNVYLSAAIASTMRRDAEAARSEAGRVIDLSRAHGVPQYLAYGEICLGWALANLVSLDAGVSMLRRALADQKEQDSLYWRPWYLGLSADLELTAGNPEAALQICDDALALAKETGEAWSDAALLRLRGDILLRLDPKTHAAVETAYDEAVRTARAQGARAFEFEAAHALAKFYQSTGRPADAHAILAPALEGLAPTPDMPEIAKAQALLSEFADTEEVKAAIGQRRRVSRLQVAYGNALIAARGYGAPETTEAFAKARESASGDEDAAGRLAADYGLWVGSYTRGELPEMRAHAEAFLADVEATP
jgi:class 3 adenylate cyclase/predicted ATPase